MHLLTGGMLVSSTKSSEGGRTKDLTRKIGAMSWAFLETMKTDNYWNLSYVQVCSVARQHAQRSAALRSIVTRFCKMRERCSRSIIRRYRN